MDRTKTGKIHYIPCHDEFKPILDQMPKTFGDFFFTNRLSRQKGNYYTEDVLNKLWNKACKKVGESIGLYPGTKHSSCSQYINERGLSYDELQTITDHARIESVKRYGKMEVQRKKELMHKKVIRGKFGVEKTDNTTNKIK